MGLWKPVQLFREGWGTQNLQRSSRTHNQEENMEIKHVNKDSQKSVYTNETLCSSSSNQPQQELRCLWRDVLYIRQFTSTLTVYCQCNFLCIIRWLISMLKLDLKSLRFLSCWQTWSFQPWWYCHIRGDHMARSEALSSYASYASYAIIWQDLPSLEDSQ